MSDEEKVKMVRNFLSKIPQWTWRIPRWAFWSIFAVCTVIRIITVESESALSLIVFALGLIAFFLLFLPGWVYLLIFVGLGIISGFFFDGYNVSAKYPFVIYEFSGDGFMAIGLVALISAILYLIIYRVDQLSQRLLRSAIERNDIDSVRNLIEKGKADVNYSLKGVTPLTVAVEVGNSEIIALLKENGAE